MRYIYPSLILGALGATTPAVAQSYVDSPPPAAAPDNSAQLQQLPPLDQLLAPVALYPDPLIALILPAAAFPTQIQAVAANLNGADDPSFDPSVQGLAHYPDIVNWLNANLTWTQQLGGAFASSPADVMNAIQDLRQRARSAGTLTPNGNEQVIADSDGKIEILPVQPEAVSVPTYDPAVVYWAPPPGYSGAYFTWSEPYPLGAWVSYDFDWHSNALWYGDWYGYRSDHGGWNRPFDGASVNISVAIGRGHEYRAPAHPPGSPISHGFFGGHTDHIVQPNLARGPGGPGRQPNSNRPQSDDRQATAAADRNRPDVARPEATRSEATRPVPTSPAPVHPVPDRPENPREVPVRNGEPRPVENTHAQPAHPIAPKVAPKPAPKPAPHPEAPHSEGGGDDHHDH